MIPKNQKQTLTRRDLLKQSVALGAIVVVGTGFIAAPNAAWAMSVQHISEHEMATLLQMARDIYTHDSVGDEYYAVAVKGYDNANKKKLVAASVAKLDAMAKARQRINQRQARQQELAKARQEVDKVKKALADSTADPKDLLRQLQVASTALENADKASSTD